MFYLSTAYWNETKHVWVGVLNENPYDYSDMYLRPGVVDSSKYVFDSRKGRYQDYDQADLLV